MTTLHERIRAELDRRTAVARAAGDQYGPCWLITRVPPYTDPLVLAGDGGGDELRAAGTVDLHEAQQVHIALHDPADALRRYAGELEVLERHAPFDQEDWSVERGRFTEPGCEHCQLTSNDGDPLYRDWPCPEIRSLASRLGVSVDG